MTKPGPSEEHPLLGRATSAPEMGHGKSHYGTTQGHAPFVRSLSNVFAWQRVREEAPWTSHLARGGLGVGRAGLSPSRAPRCTH